MKRALALGGTLLALVVLNVVLPRVTNPYYFQVLMLIGINIVLAVSLNLVNGFTGQFSIGHAGFMAVGAYTSAMFTLKLGAPLAASWAYLPPPVAQGLVLLMALVAGGLLAAVAGWVVGLPSLRLRGDYLAIVTLGFGEIIRVLILNIDAIGAARGLPGIPQYSTFFWVFGCAVLVIVVARRVATSTHGRALFAIRDDEVAAEALGVDTTRYKVLAFVLGAFFAGVAGGLFAHFLSYLNPSSFTFLKSIEVIAMVVLGGMGSISGSVMAAVILTLLPEVLRPVKEYRMVLYSLMLIVLMITRPQGLLGTRELDFTRFFRWGRSPAKGPAA
jgi:branched-chain amino acid transport system permease protein